MATKRDYLKAKLHSVPFNGYNRFSIISQKKFATGSEVEEIDLLVETDYTLIIGEVKCIKYPFSGRDYHAVFSNTIEFAEKQIMKGDQNAFRSIYNIENKKIIKVIVLNFPAFTGTSINNIPIIDCIELQMELSLSHL